jgi:hypothetical protein
MSNINPQNIDGTYPIAGQDNNSQGFRDNFTNTVNNFTFAAAELTDLQNNAILRSPLGSVGQTSVNNTLNQTQIIGAQTLQFTETKIDLGTISSGGTVTVDWTQAHFQTVALSGSATLAFSTTWPTNNLFTKLRLQVTTSANAAAFTMPSAVSTNLYNIQGVSGQIITLPAAGKYQFEFTTYDNGTTIAIEDVLRNYNTEISGNIGNFLTANISGNLTATIITSSTGSNANVTIDPDGTGDLVLPNNTSLLLLDTSTTNSATTGALVNLGGAAIQGNLYTGGARIVGGYQTSLPTANVAVTVNSNVERLIIAPTSFSGTFGAIVTLPNVTVDGTVVSISSNAAVGGLQVNSGWTGVVTVSPSANVSLSAGSQAMYLYYATGSKWFKIA